MAGKTERGHHRQGDSKKRKRDTSEKERTSEVKRPRSKSKHENGTAGKSKKHTTNPDELKDNAARVISDLTLNGNLDATRSQKTRSKNAPLPEDATWSSGWKLSPPSGGRIADVDPVFSQDEQYLILTYRSCLQIYTVSDSLLVRKIPLPVIKASGDVDEKEPAFIIATCLSISQSDHVWVGCSDGRIWKINWKESSQPIKTIHTQSLALRGMSVSAYKPTDTSIDVLFVSEKRKDANSICAYWPGKEAPRRKVLFEAQHLDMDVRSLRSTSNGLAIVGAHADGLVVGTLKSSMLKEGHDLDGTFYSFDTNDTISSLDIRLSSAKQVSANPKKKSAKPTAVVVDLVAGGARGALYVYNDIINKLQNMKRASQAKKDRIEARKLHWHRKAVHSVKWSADGHYLISGGSENVLTLWQVDTGKMNHLPHMPGNLENIVVSPSGSSYAVSLDDNSAMVISTSEMKPTTYVSGIQTAVRYASPPKDSLVLRMASFFRDVRSPVPAVMDPLNATKLHVCVGAGQQAVMTGTRQAAPMLQSFDLESLRSVSRQALARTQPTDVNMTSEGHPITEPAITHMAFSCDGRWLATVDDWQPPIRDTQKVSAEAREQMVNERREIYLKFWAVSPDAEPLELTSRVNSPHSTSRPESVLALAADPKAPRFATLGDDGLVRIWHAKTRQRDGLAATDAKGGILQSWSCYLTVGMGSNVGADVLATSEGLVPSERTGSLAFSEDGSSLFVAFGSEDDGTVFVVDATTGQVRTTLEHLWKGHVRRIQVLSPYVITLSDDLRVYDVVADELQYGVTLPQLDEEAGYRGFHHLEADKRSRTFALVVPGKSTSEIAVFRPEDPVPLSIQRIPEGVISLASSTTTSGYVMVDDAAQLRTVIEVSDQTSIALPQSLEDLHLEEVTAKEGNKSNGFSLVEESDGDDDEDEDARADGAEMDVDVDEDDDVHAAVISRQKLAEVFDAAPAFAMPSIEDMFYKVTGLLATKPLATA